MTFDFAWPVRWSFVLNRRYVHLLWIWRGRSRDLFWAWKKLGNPD